MPKGKLIVVDGLDGSGKATQTELLVEALKKRGYPVMKVSFPNYESDSSALVRMYLHGDFGSKPSDVNAYAASAFYAVDRYASYKSEEWGKFYDNGGIVIADRYTTSNAIHQCAKLPMEERMGFLYWLYSFEYGYLKIPMPNEVFYLMVEPEISQKLMTERYHGDETKKDIHEGNIGFMKASYEAARLCINFTTPWVVVHCDDGQKMRSIDDIQKELLDCMLKWLAENYDAKGDSHA